MRQMRTVEQYEVECLCGELLTSPTRELVCPKCRREIRVDWGSVDG
jgi:Zn finger protein HypA/HybF involved in hydrogenase expression